VVTPELPDSVVGAHGGDGEERLISVPSFALPVGTVTFLLIDIDSSTARWGQDPGAISAAVNRYHEILEAVGARWGGVRPLEQGEGETAVMAFHRAIDGLAAATEAQQWLTEELGDVFAVRMALHTGEAQLWDEGVYFGETVNRCARVIVCGHGGQVLCTQAVVELVGERVPDGVYLTDLGAHRLRDLGRAERIWQVDVHGLQSAFPPLRSLDAYRHNLPAALTTFIGRRVELADLRAVLARTDARLVSLVGAGGCGKTRLALQLASDLVDAHPGGVWWAELAAARDASDVGRALLDALGAREWPGRAAADVAAATIGDADVLLVVDNCEHLLGEVAEVIDPLLRRCPQLRIVTTSREPLAVAGEIVWRVPSLGVPVDEPGRPVDLDHLSQLESVCLFLDRARRARPNFALTEANAPAIAQICARLDGIPLAIELAAARCRLLSPERIADQLDDRFRLLTGGSRAATPRQQTLLASVEWSHQLLDAKEQAVFRRLSSFTGTFGLDAAEAVCADGNLVEALEVLDVVGRLVDKSLLQTLDPTRPGGDVRYRMLETVRQYALDRCSAADELTSTRDRHLDHYVTWLEQIDGLHPSDVVIDAVAEDYANLRAALVWADRRPEQGLRLLRQFAQPWGLLGRYGDVVALGLPPLQRHRREYPELWAAAAGVMIDPLQFALGSSLHNLADDILDTAGSVGDDYTVAYCCAQLGMLRPESEAVELWCKGVEAGRRAQDRFTEGTNQLLLAQIALLGGDLSSATTELLRVGLDGYTSVGNRTFGLQRAWFESIAPILGGDLSEGVRVARAATRDTAPPIEPLSRSMAAAALAYLGLLTVDDDLLSRAGAVLDEHVGPWDVAFATSMITAVRACEWLRSGAHDDPGVDAMSLLSSHWRGWHTDLGVAVSLAVGAPVVLDAPALRELGPYQHCRHGLAGAYRAIADGDLGAAEDAVRDSLTLAVTHGYRLAIVDGLETLASLTDDRVAWSRLLGATGRLRTEAAYRYRWPHLTRLLGDRVDDLDEAGFEAGGQLDAAGAVALAARSRGARKRPAHGWASLTPTELAVVEQVAAGHTNPQIAEQLLMSRATVKTHLAHVFAKLGVATRSELAAMATARRSAD